MVQADDGLLSPQPQPQPQPPPTPTPTPIPNPNPNPHPNPNPNPIPNPNPNPHPNPNPNPNPNLLTHVEHTVSIARTLRYGENASVLIAYIYICLPCNIVYKILDNSL